MAAGLVKAAENAAKPDPATGQTDTAALAKRFNKAQTDLAKTAPIGWPRAAPERPLDWALMFAGWILTAFAGLMGAPFWFDSLQRLVNVRNAGPKPA